MSSTSSSVLVWTIDTFCRETITFASAQKSNCAPLTPVGSDSNDLLEPEQAADLICTQGSDDSEQDGHGPQTSTGPGSKTTLHLS